MNKIKISSISREKHVLAGSPAGKRMRDALWGVAKASRPGLFVSDYLGVTVATSSFLREAVVGFRDLVRTERPDVYPVVSNLNVDVEEELVGLLNQMGEAFWVFDLLKGEVKKHRLIGRIDPKLRETLDLIDRGLGYDAATLWKSTNSVESIGVTAWNNRLANLAKQGLVFESRVGKQKYFHPLHECRGE
jgi:hypothetical protein